MYSSQWVFPGPCYGESLWITTTDGLPTEQSRILIQRTFLRQSTVNKTLQIQAIGLSLYESIPGTTAEQIGKEVVRTQWL